MLFTRKKLELPTQDEALPGRDATMPEASLRAGALITAVSRSVTAGRWATPGVASTSSTATPPSTGTGLFMAAGRVHAPP